MTARAGSEVPVAPAPRRTLGHAFTIVVGLLGWFVVLGLPALHLDPHDLPSGPFSIGMFVTVILAARALAFRLEESVLSLDSAYFAAAALCVGTSDAGTLGALSLTVDASVRLAMALRHTRDPADGWGAAVGYVLYFVGMSGALLVISGWMFGADKLVGIHPAPGDAASHGVLIAGLLLVSHYTIQGVRHALLGHSLRAYFKELAVPGIIAEASLMPIGVVLVLLHESERLLGFVLLSATYLLINYVFARLSRTSQQLEERVHDLEILNATARRFSSSLQVEALVESVARETSNAIPESDAVALIHRRGGLASALQYALLYEPAMVDGLTGRYVRRYFDARIEEEVERAKRYKNAFSVIMMDIDDFKKLNDTNGHLVGDRVLRAIANVVKGQLRGVDTAARFGGEELAVILPRIEMVGAYNLAVRFREGIAELRITTDDEPPKVLNVTASLGIAAFPESKAQDGTDLVRRADRALYRAKKMGKIRA